MLSKGACVCVRVVCMCCVCMCVCARITCMSCVYVLCVCIHVCARVSCGETCVLDVCEAGRGRGEGQEKAAPRFLLHLCCVVLGRQAGRSICDSFTY